MSKLDRLLAELCPDGVEYKMLGDVCMFQNGFAFKSNLFKNTGKPILCISNIQNDKIDTNNLVYFDDKDYNENLKPYIINKGDIVIAMSGATTGKIGVNTSDNIYYMNQRVGKIFPHNNILNYRFLYHILSSKVQEIYLMAGGGAQPNLNSEQMKKKQIPLPPLPIQQEIVLILDNFTELTAELTARKKQYEYYRNNILTRKYTNDLNTKRITLGDIYDFQYEKGNVIPTTGGQYPVYGSNGIVGNHSEYNSENSPVIGHIGAYAGIVNWGYGKHFVTYNGVICKLINNDVHYKFAYYLLLLQNFGLQAKSGSQPFISYDILQKPVVIIPSMTEQKRIVSILDRFEALTSDISSGLPAEIAARKKQYEYYRGKLFTFKNILKGVYDV